MGYIFEWESKKAASNVRKHGVAFDEASTVFGDPFALLMPDPDHSLREMRYILLGMSNRRRLLVVAFAERPAGDSLNLGKARNEAGAEKV